MLVRDTVNKQIFQIEHELLRIPTGRRGPVGYLHNAMEELSSGLPTANPHSGRVKDLNQGAPDFKSSTLIHSATSPLNHCGNHENYGNYTTCR